MTHRTKRVGELIRRELSNIIEKDYTFTGKFVTIHAVDVAADLKNCTVFTGIMGGKDEDHQSVIDRLNKITGPLQKALYKRVILKNSPRLYFKLDRSAERGVRIVNAIEELPMSGADSDEPMGKFEGSDGLDHRWEKAENDDDRQR